MQCFKDMFILIITSHCISNSKFYIELELRNGTWNHIKYGYEAKYFKRVKLAHFFSGHEAQTTKQEVRGFQLDSSNSTTKGISYQKAKRIKLQHQDNKYVPEINCKRYILFELIAWSFTTDQSYATLRKHENVYTYRCSGIHSIKVNAVGYKIMTVLTTWNEGFCFSLWRNHECSSDAQSSSVILRIHLERPFRDRWQAMHRAQMLTERQIIQSTLAGWSK